MAGNLDGILDADDKTVIALLMALNNKAEQEAIYDYTEALNALESIKTKFVGSDRVEMQELVNSIKEIISDELNHAQKLTQYYELITGIKPAKD